MSAFRRMLGVVVFGFVLLPAFAHAASISLDPATATYGPGDTFIVTVRLDNENDCVNAVNVALSYPTSSLRAVDFSRGDSILSLWVGDPVLDTQHGTVSFTGGIPGGYCGHIQGDSSYSDVLGEVIFQVVSPQAQSAQIQILPSSSVYLDDGQGTKAPLTTMGSVITLAATSTSASNPWLAEVAQDTTPPEPFDIYLESTAGVFGGDYYLVFSTTDKQSGLDHYELFENNAWKVVTSPYRLPDQSLLMLKNLQVRAVDKAGNTRSGTLATTTPPPRQYSLKQTYALVGVVLVVLLLVLMHLIYRRSKPSIPPPR